jgi:hypothetical protein
MWPEVLLLWLPAEPDASANSLLGRLEGKFPEGQLRALQRRGKDWRRVLPRHLVHGCRLGVTAGHADHRRVERSSVFSTE